MMTPDQQDRKESMSSPHALTVFAPATVANVASGFDVLGFALEKPGDTLRLEVTARKEVRIVSIAGDDGRLPREADKNTAAVAAVSFLTSIGFPFGLDITLTKQMPLSSGLGSSAASSVAAVFGANILAGNPLSGRELLAFTLEAERVACGSAHADNVAPALLGGFVLIRSYDPLDIVTLPVPQGLAAAVVHPHTEVKTEDARRILKKELRLTDAVRQWGNLAALVAALYESDVRLLGRSLQDVVAEPRRALLIPGFSRVKEGALAAGALGCSISGSGPSVFSLCASLEEAEEVGKAMQAGFSEVRLESDLYVSAINRTGPVIIKDGPA
jgi:homoserine kinase